MAPPPGPTSNLPRTKTLPEAERGAWYEGPDTVTMLRVFGRALALELPRDGSPAVLGSSPDGDLVIADRHVSREHCRIERYGARTRVVDLDSHNGTFFRGRRQQEFDIQPGETFDAAGVRLLAMNDAMRAQYGVVAAIVGDEDEHTREAETPSPSELVVMANAGHHLSIFGDTGCGQDRLANAIHAMSLRRDRPLSVLSDVPEDRAGQRTIIDSAARSTLVVPIGEKTKRLDRTFASMIFSSSYHIRVIALAQHPARVATVLGADQASLLQRIWLLPLVQRQGAILPLLDRIFEQRGVALRTSQLTPQNQAAMRAYGWPKNLDELHMAADRLSTLAEANPKQFEAAAALTSRSASTMHGWLVRRGLSLPLFAPR